MCKDHDALKCFYRYLNIRNNCNKDLHNSDKSDIVFRLIFNESRSALNVLKDYCKENGVDVEALELEA